MNKTIQQTPPSESQLSRGKNSIIAALSVVGLTTAALLATPDRAAAAIVWDYSPATTGADIQPGSGYVWVNDSSAQNFSDQFLLGQDTTLTGMDIYTRDDFLSIGQSVTVRLWSDNSGTPGTLLQNFTEALAAVDTQSAGSDLSVRRSFANFVNPVSVLANTRYWIGMSGMDSELGQLTLTGLNAPGDNTVARFNGTTFFTNDSIGDQAFRLHGNATAVPTPALLPGLVGMGMAAWRKRKAVASALGTDA
jgi:hypothetical protein